MSIRLSENEKIIRNYDYASVGVQGVAGASHTSKSLTITNKRIIHREVSTGLGRENIRTTEIPVGSAKFVDTFYGMKSFNILLVLGVIFALLAVVTFIIEDIPMAIALVLLVIAAICIIVYIFKHEYILVCVINTDTHITPAFRCSSKSGSSATNGIFTFLKKADRSTTINIKVNVKKEVAKQIANELGSVIADAAAGIDIDEGTVDPTSSEAKNIAV